LGDDDDDNDLLAQVFAGKAKKARVKASPVLMKTLVTAMKRDVSEVANLWVPLKFQAIWKDAMHTKHNFVAILLLSFGVAKFNLDNIDVHVEDGGDEYVVGMKWPHFMCDDNALHAGSGCPTTRKTSSDNIPGGIQ
jgi:hypothetical protein